MEKNPSGVSNLPNKARYAIIVVNSSLKAEKSANLSANIFALKNSLIHRHQESAQDILVILQVVVDALNTDPVPLYRVHHQVFMFLEMDCPVSPSPQPAVITQLQGVRHMGKASHRAIEILHDVHRRLLALELI